jgi:hypothetical protein
LEQPLGFLEGGREGERWRRTGSGLLAFGYRATSSCAKSWKFSCSKRGFRKVVGEGGIVAACRGATGLNDGAHGCRRSGRGWCASSWDEPTQALRGSASALQEPAVRLNGTSTPLSDITYNTNHAALVSAPGSGRREGLCETLRSRQTPALAADLCVCVFVCVCEQRHGFATGAHGGA